jgi:hypothetical protein
MKNNSAVIRYYQYASLLLLLYCAAFCSCATLKERKPSPVRLTNTAKFVLLPPDKLAKPIDSPCQIEGSYGGQEFIFDAYTLANETTVNLALFSGAGAKIASVQYNGETVSIDSSFLPQNAKPEYIIADFQIIFYDAAAIANDLNRIGLGFTSVINETENGAEEIRTVLNHNDDIITVVKTESRVDYINRLRGYTYTIYGDFSWNRLEKKNY